MAKEITPHIEEQIRTRAYFLWEADGRPHGRDWEYWMKAQQELTAANGSTAATNTAAAPVRKASAAAAAEKAPASTTKRRAGSRSAVYA